MEQRVYKESLPIPPQLNIRRGFAKCLSYLDKYWH